jgi:DNA-binding transcriptional LysR family regulator
VLPKSAVQDDLASGRLTQVVVQDTPLGARVIQLVTRSEGGLSAAAKQVAMELPILAKWFGNPK